MVLKKKHKHCAICGREMPEDRDVCSVCVKAQLNSKEIIKQEVKWTWQN